MSPMWLTSKTPTLPRTALCSAISPPLDGYSTGMSHPPKSTILAPRRRCNAFSGVLRSSLLCGVAADSIPVAQAEIDTSTRSHSGQRSPPETSHATARRCATRASRLPPPCRGLSCSGRVFLRGSYGGSDRLHAMRLTRRSLHLCKILHHLQGPAKRTP